VLNTELNKDIEHLRRDLTALREDVSSLATSMKQVAAVRGREALNRIEELGERAKLESKELKESAARGIGEHPFTSVLTSFGLGFVIGMVLERKR
jgi:ElaB/YqjD/DUF883 family membrane-anchored ribosome-binding protein